MKTEHECVSDRERAQAAESQDSLFLGARMQRCPVLGYRTNMSNTNAASTEIYLDTQDRQDRAAELFQVFASPIRLGVVRSLLHGERSVTDLMSELNLAQSRLSNHLACLRNCGVVQTRRDGNFIYYQIADQRVGEMLAIGEDLATANARELAHCDVLKLER
ncbi:MAG: hypothetical protein NVSMB52_10650 [Chloroflexota bacterium]